MAKTDLLKVNNFLIQFKDTKQLELMVTNSPLPGFSINPLTLSRPVVDDKRPGGQLTYTDLSLTVLCDEDLNAFKEIYSYLILAANPNTGDLEINKTVFDSTLFILTNKNNIQHKVYFYNCFFTRVGDLVFNSNATDADHITFDIDLSYSFYNFI